MAVWPDRFQSICLNVESVRIAGSPARSSVGYRKDVRSDSGKGIPFEGDQPLFRVNLIRKWDWTGSKKKQGL